jgi:low temperature requirement protein LtrA
LDEASYSVTNSIAKPKITFPGLPDFTGNFTIGSMAAAAATSVASAPASLMETLFLTICYIVTAFLLWWIYFEDFSQHTIMTTEIVTVQSHTELKEISPLYDRLRHMWIYIHLAIHTGSHYIWFAHLQFMR